MTEGEIKQMVKAGELPAPRSGRWNWLDVDAAMSRESGDRESIYFIEMGDFIKIGRSINVHARARELDAFLPLPTRLLHHMRGTCDQETDLHRKFKHLRTKGEWFRREEDLVSYIDNLVSGVKPHVR